MRNINQVISSAMDMAVEQKIILSNPTKACALPKVEKQEMKTLSAEQLASFLREAANSGVYEMYYLDLATGLRHGELLELKWSDIDMTAGWVKGSPRVIASRRLAVCEKLFGLTLILQFFDRCGISRPASSATGSAERLIPKELRSPCS